MNESNKTEIVWNQTGTNIVGFVVDGENMGAEAFNEMMQIAGLSTISISTQLTNLKERITHERTITEKLLTLDTIIGVMMKKIKIDHC